MLAIVFGMIERGGNLIAKVVPNKTATTLRPIILANVITNPSVFEALMDL